MVHTEQPTMPGRAPSHGKLVVAMLRCLQQAGQRGRDRTGKAEAPEWRPIDSFRTTAR
jgi:hypothetical protein